MSRGFVLLAQGVVDHNIAGTVLCGNEERRGILRHLAVKRAFRYQGIARKLVDEVLAALAHQGIRRCNTCVM